MYKQTQVTKDGLEALKKELNELVEVKRPKMVTRLANARSQGDLSENSDYQNARDELEFLDGRISELEEVIRSAVVVQSNGSKNEVVMGTNVRLKVNDQEHQFSIVGEWEADPAAKKISHTSPLGEALMGKKKGDKVEVEAPAGKIVYEVLAIES
jgi:transcription elongation factor GreA